MAAGAVSASGEQTPHQMYLPQQSEEPIKVRIGELQRVQPGAVIKLTCPEEVEWSRTDLPLEVTFSTTNSWTT